MRESRSSRREFLRVSSVALLGAAVQGAASELAPQSSDPIIDIHQHVGYSGRPDDVLLSVATELDATLVAVGSHGLRRGPGIVVGSVATRMLYDAPCSVLVAR